VAVDLGDLYKTKYPPHLILKLELGNASLEKLQLLGLGKQELPGKGN
jgi:hypothetical protein